MNRSGHINTSIQFSAEKEEASFEKNTHGVHNRVHKIIKNRKDGR